MYGFENGKEFIFGLAGKKIDLIYLDLRMPEVDGFKVLRFLKNKGITIPVIVLSALSRKETILKAVYYGIKSYIIKPVSINGLVRKTAILLNRMF